ncbi:type I restriction enzyme EcoKI subunit R [Bremerella volcania]|uniref:Type I restriction enzyme EcoKI subunit R n=1 Tax=Bremerella volcania TaxID=2527984 RepID=A0A518CCK8_9BACT|nr:DEAD/DEAH box helicase family protein [Bremerella volcania]QDU76934.1 type I restriction enzyme EcoKI subunit R [Bremerella volcania]
MPNEADTCRRYVVPRLQTAGWDNDPYRINEQVTFTDGRIIVAGRRSRRRPGKRADYILRYRPDFAIAVVEAKPTYATPGEGLQQAKDYAEILGLKFAYATNGHGIIEFDYTTGLEREIAAFPTPEELWTRLTTDQSLTTDAAERVLSPTYHLSGKSPRYYQEIAINRAVQAVAQGDPRILLTMATGTGKTVVAFQICWKLWNSRWNRTGEHRRPRILFLADRNILVDDPMAKDFAPFGDARWKIAGGRAVQSREMYFAIYQSIARDANRPGLYREFAPDFFDLIVVDECHRGSARDDSNWREILDYFQPAIQIGMTATPRREDNADTYDYFGDSIYTYSLRQGIDDGFLAPYRVHRVVTTWDAAGWRPSQGDLDRYGRQIPDGEYHTGEFERIVSLRARTEAVAHHLTEYMRRTDRFAKTIVFCVDQEHADEMRRSLNNLNADLVRDNPDYVCRVTSDEGDIGRGHLSNFQDLERRTPVILTTSQLLTTGVDAPTVQNIVLLRVINSMTEFKQIIGRGTRVRDDYGKLFFSILDYTGSATRLFADPDFDGDPTIETEQTIDEDGEPVEEETVVTPEEESEEDDDGPEPLPPDGPDDPRRKFYFDGGQVEIAAHLVYELDPDGNQLRVIQFTDYTADKVRTLFRNAAELRDEWADPEKRSDIIERLEDRGIDFDHLAETANQPDADPLDLICHLAFNAPLRTRRERAQRLRTDRTDFFDQFGPDAKEILDELLDKYTEHGTAQFVIPDVLEIPPISAHGNVIEIASRFGGVEQLRQAVIQLQTLLYAAA